MDDDLVVLLDDERKPIGTLPKADVHGANTPLHLAFSVYVFDAGGRLLVTRRALNKLTWPGIWSNSCCGHVRPGEEPVDAVRRRLDEELGLTVSSLDVVLPDFAYRATSPEGVVENEVCPVFVATADADPVPNPAEVVQWDWSDWSSFRASALNAPWLLSPWAVLQVAELPEDLPSRR
jgi:isopentenyl-diphosphate delta-isomerase